MSTLDAMFATLRREADDWDAEVARRVRITRADPVADTLTHCAGRLRALVEALAQDLHWVSVEDYARLHGCTPATVRRRIQRGVLDAIETPHGRRLRPHAGRATPIQKVS